MRTFTTLLVVVVFGTVATATIPSDSLPKKPSRYYGSIRSAVLPCRSCYQDGKVTGLVSTVHGIRLNRNFSTGVGAGLTSSGSMWIVPVFGNVRMSMYGKKTNRNSLFLDFNYGWGLAPSNVRRDEFGSQTTKSRNYFQPSVGYSVAYHDLRIGFMLGLQYVRTSTIYEYPGYGYTWGLIRQASTSTTVYDYSVGRMLLGISIGWLD